jgi:hypothetical protein
MPSDRHPDPSCSPGEIAWTAAASTRGVPGGVVEQVEQLLHGRCEVLVRDGPAVDDEALPPGVDRLGARPSGIRAGGGHTEVARGAGESAAASARRRSVGTGRDVFAGLWPGRALWRWSPLRARAVRRGRSAAQVAHGLGVGERFFEVERDLPSRPDAGPCRSSSWSVRPPSRTVNTWARRVSRLRASSRSSGVAAASSSTPRVVRLVAGARRRGGRRPGYPGRRPRPRVRAGRSGAPGRWRAAAGSGRPGHRPDNRPAPPTVTTGVRRPPPPARAFRAA